MAHGYTAAGAVALGVAVVGCINGDIESLLLRAAANPVNVF